MLPEGLTSREEADGQGEAQTGSCALHVPVTEPTEPDAIKEPDMACGVGRSASLVEQYGPARDVIVWLLNDVAPDPIRRVRVGRHKGAASDR